MPYFVLNTSGKDIWMIDDERAGRLWIDLSIFTAHLYLNFENILIPAFSSIIGIQVRQCDIYLQLIGQCEICLWCRVTVTLNDVDTCLYAIVVAGHHIARLLCRLLFVDTATTTAAASQ